MRDGSDPCIRAGMPMSVVMALSFGGCKLLVVVFQAHLFWGAKSAGSTMAETTAATNLSRAGSRGESNSRI